METADVVIAGGGIMGCALAYQLAKRKVDVVLLERAELGSQSTGKCAGGIRQQFSSEVNVRMQMLSMRLFDGFEEETGAPAGLRKIGYLFLLTRPALVEEFKDHLEMWHRVGLTEARWASPEEAREMVPILNVDDVLGCTFCPSDGLASPADVTAGYAAAARRLGARIREGSELTGVQVRGGKVSGVRTGLGEIATRVVFNCAGAWSSQVGKLAGVDVPVVPLRRHIAVTGPFPEVSRTTPMTVDFASSFYFHPEGDGLLFGMSDRDEPPTYDEEVNWDFVEKMVEAAVARAPALERAGIQSAWAGLYESTPDNHAILGPAEGVEGFWCACGFSGHGFMQAPAAAVLLTELLLDGRSEIDISAFRHRRFSQEGLPVERNVI